MTIVPQLTAKSSDTNVLGALARSQGAKEQAVARQQNAQQPDNLQLPTHMRTQTDAKIPPHRNRAKAARVEDALKGFDKMARDELCQKWHVIYGCAPPVGVSRQLLTYSAAWDMQAKQLSAHSRQTRQLLHSEMERIVSIVNTVNDRAVNNKAETDNQDHLAQDKSQTGGSSGAASRVLPQRRQLMPGARLIRDWNGRSHVVDVVMGGYLYEGSIHRSLSAIARTITGAHWSGPRFFGL